ncbi:hypothetical protein ES319_D04G025300v1 [Gossypium barbadense]|uniref:Uncharacterized protein n=3 Tax=Gossypium TaxID=3633 RepID=A0A5J5RUP9_GOSBA|nr:hypothetical protein ES319_D05G142900v1 [Gossypium barbadense]TYG72510.1 hypothetical protein ES288_D04G026600v1 [Gossypium darwinii]TYH45709.1 hypothetical protein ES332_D11G283900v1 [Gossypium tomentosum]KAB2033549.1 hypothetical protein ES319_D04G025300v1 [Gossypium barbadense]TYH46374.1 hypothetical protein ES332_D11G331000v1 [Gossypium tomentosum]
MHVSPDQLWPHTKVFLAFGFVHKITTFEKTAEFQSGIYILNGD